MKEQQVTTGALILRGDKKFLVTKRSIDDEYMPGLWELPGGSSEYEESAQQACAREIKEETGLDVVVCEPVAVLNYFREEIHKFEIVFVCVPKDPNQPVVLSSEHSEFAWISLDEIARYNFDEFMTTEIKNATENLDYWMHKHFSA